MFTAKTLSFLRVLKRNNRREWFQPRKEEIRDARASADPESLGLGKVVFVFSFSFGRVATAKK
jgi:hypothetical protein